MSASCGCVQAKATVSLLSVSTVSISPNFAKPPAIAEMRRAAPLPSPAAVTRLDPFSCGIDCNRELRFLIEDI